MATVKKKTPTCSAKTAVAYARYSSSVQRDVSIEQQLQDIRAYAAREGYMLVHEYQDHAKSGFKRTSARSEFQAMLSAAETGQFDTIIAWKVDRFGRNREESAIFKGRLRRFGVSVVYAMEPIPEGAAGVLLEGMLEATAEWYSRNLSENVSRGMTDNARRGLYNGNPIAGYIGVPNQPYRINEEEAPIVRRIFELYCSGYTYSGISRQLASEGILNRRGKPYGLFTLQNILSNESYIGIYHWGGIRIPGGMPALIDKATWEAAQTMKKYSTRRVTREGVPEFILSGVAVCGACGRPLIGDSGTSKSGEKHYYYSCSGKRGRNAPGCSLRSIRKEFLEDTVIDFVMDRILTGPEMERIADVILEKQQSVMKKSPLVSMEAELAAIHRKIDNINRAIEEGIWDASTAERLRTLSDEEKTLRQSVETLRYSQEQLLDRDRILFFLHRFASGDRKDPVHRKHLVSTFINRVVVYPDRLEITVNAKDGNDRITIAAAGENGSDENGLVYQNSAGPNIYVMTYTKHL